MSDKPIPFKPEMVRALLAGTKTQTRRAIKRQPYGRYIPLISFNHGRMEIAFGPDMKAKDGGPLWWRPLAQPGDLLWVREHWRTWAQYDGIAPRDLTPGTHIAYEATKSPNLGNNAGRFRPGMFMPRWASRITLTVTNVRVERLQDISEADAIAEGVRPFPGTGSYVSLKHPDGKYRFGDNAYTMYRDLWNAINGPGSWGANPWVAAYTFTAGLHNIDAPNVRQIGDEWK